VYHCVFKSFFNKSVAIKTRNRNILSFTVHLFKIFPKRLILKINSDRMIAENSFTYSKGENSIMADLGLQFTKDQVITGIEASTDLEAIEKAAKRLHELGLVKESFIEAIQEREKVFATGLPTEGYGVAVPHTDVEHVEEQSIAIAVLKDTVPFKVMGGMDETVDVKIMFMLALKEPHSQLAMLQGVIGMVQKPEVLQTLSEESSTEKIYDLVMNELENMEIDE